MRVLTDAEALTRRLANTRLAASTSFSEGEVLALGEVITKLLRGADLRAMARSPELANIMRKVLSMKGTLDRQRVRRAAIVAKESV